MVQNRNSTSYRDGIARAIAAAFQWPLPEAAKYVETVVAETPDFGDIDLDSPAPPHVLDELMREPDQVRLWVLSWAMKSMGAKELEVEGHINITTGCFELSQVRAIK